MIKVWMYLKHASRTTRKEWWFQHLPRAGDFLDHGGVRYRVTSILHKTTPGGGNVIHLFCLRLQKQPNISKYELGALTSE